jgi:hypothetical protein
VGALGDAIPRPGFPVEFSEVLVVHRASGPGIGSCCARRAREGQVTERQCQDASCGSDEATPGDPGRPGRSAATVSHSADTRGSRGCDRGH